MVIIVICLLIIDKLLCVTDTIKNINVKVLNLMSGTNETRHIKWHKTCKYRCRVDASVFKNKDEM